MRNSRYEVNIGICLNYKNIIKRNNIGVIQKIRAELRGGESVCEAIMGSQAEFGIASILLVLDSFILSIFKFLVRHSLKSLYYKLLLFSCLILSS